jgi:hypothetical protein
MAYLDFVIPSAFFLAREPALSGAEGNLLFQRWTTEAAPQRPTIGAARFQLLPFD